MTTEFWDYDEDEITYDELEDMSRRAAERERRRAIRRRKRRMIVYTMRFLVCMAGMLLVFGIVLLIRKDVPVVVEEVDEAIEVWNEEKETETVLRVLTPPEYTIDFITPNEYSRPQEALPAVNNIFVHYTANPGTSAAQNKSYFENLGITGETSASAHFVIGYEGEIIQCLPLEEIGYAVQTRNYDSISIECCYIAENGKFTQATYDSLVELLAWLVGKYDLVPEDIWRHYDQNGKNCPKYYAEHEDAWTMLLGDVERYIKENGTEVDRMEAVAQGTTQAIP